MGSEAGPLWDAIDSMCMARVVAALTECVRETPQVLVGTCADCKHVVYEQQLDISIEAREKNLARAFAHQGTPNFLDAVLTELLQQCLLILTLLSLHFDYDRNLTVAVLRAGPEAPPGTTSPSFDFGRTENCTDARLREELVQRFGNRHSVAELRCAQ